MVNGFKFREDFKVRGRGFDHIGIVVANYNLEKDIMFGIAMFLNKVTFVQH